ncbi:MAG TPA: hypothetical protein VMZ06_02740 [Candidatus Bathyarchaeia archaeon]|nr:hypothetical protein [Candidatus Bathyarchaeia archaeon]
MDTKKRFPNPELTRRTLLKAAALGTAVAGVATHAVAASDKPVWDLADAPVAPVRSKAARVKVAFVYPPTSQLDKEGYYSWPGSGFDAEGRQKQYTEQLRGLGKDLNIELDILEQNITDDAGAVAFGDSVKAAKPDAVLLILFKKGHWPQLKKVVEQAGVPALVVAPLGILLVEMINELRLNPGVYLINSEAAMDGIATGLRMVRGAFWMKNSRLMDLAPEKADDKQVPVIGTTLHTVPLERFYEAYKRTTRNEAVQKLGRAYMGNAKGLVEPNEEDVLEAARCYFAMRDLIAAEQADALTMTCLPGLQNPHKHVPPCMSFMTLRDQGFPAGCQSDLNSALTLMLVEYLFDRPGFMQNASMDTEANLYFGAHCTCPAYMGGRGSKPEPYILRSHAEAGWGCVPRVLLKEGQRVTMALYKSGDKPGMIVYAGEIVRCPEIPPVGGCRTNALIRFDGVKDACTVKGMHQIVFYGDYAEPLRDFCQLYGIPVVA